MRNLYDRYCTSIHEWAIKFYIFFLDNFTKIRDDKVIEDYSYITSCIISETIVYSYMLHEVLSFKKIVKVRDGVLKILAGNASTSLIKTLTKVAPDSSKFADFVWKRYEEYGNVFIKKNECNLLYYPAGFPKEMYNDGFSCLLLRFHGIMFKTITGDYGDIPGIEKEPLVLDGDIFSSINRADVFHLFFSTVLDEAVRDIRKRFRSFLH